MTSGEHLGYRPALDGIRGVAIIMVVLWHSDVRIGRAGFLGVDVFFVLSGYLITTLLVREHERSGVRLSRFYARRASRLYPALILMVLLGLPVAHALSSDHTVGGYLTGAGASLTYTQNLWWTLVGNPTSLGHTWSLATEEQFYLLWPLVLIWALRRGRRFAAQVAAVGALTSFALFALLLHPRTTEVPVVYYAPVTHAGGLLLGCWLAFRLGNGRTAPRGAAWGGVVVLLATSLLAFAADGAERWESVLIPAASVGTALLIAGVLTRGGAVTRILSWRPMTALGRISYGVYLFHIPVLAVMSAHWYHERRWLGVAYFVVSVAIATASYLLVEKPLRNHLNERIDRSQLFVT